MKLHADSHLDHSLPKAVVDHLLEKFADRSAFFIETVTLPPELGEVPNGLYGPEAGDDPVLEQDVFYAARGERKYTSRLIRKPVRSTRKVTVIAGPHDGQSCVLYTAFGGPQTPREPGDPELPGEKRAEAEQFWSQHALSSE